MESSDTGEAFQFLNFAGQVQQHYTALQTELARLAGITPAVPPPAGANKAEPPEHLARLARLQAARAAVQLAAQLLEVDDQEAAAPLVDLGNTLAGQVKEWRRSGRGWFEDRMIRKFRLIFGQDEKGELYLEDIREVYYGPYRYYRWRQAGKLKTHYMGRVDAIEGHEEQAAAIRAVEDAATGYAGIPVAGRAAPASESPTTPAAPGAPRWSPYYDTPEGMRAVLVALERQVLRARHQLNAARRAVQRGREPKTSVEKQRAEVTRLEDVLHWWQQRIERSHSTPRTAL